MEQRVDETFEIRRNRVLCAVLGVAGAVMAIAYLHRAGDGGGTLDWVLCVLMALIGVVHLAGLLDARTPLLVADEQGIRIRLGREWLGLPWSTLEQVVVEQRESSVRDGRLVVVPRNLGNALEALLPTSRRTVAWQRRLHGAPLTVPLSLATRWNTADVLGDLRSLAQGRAEVVPVRGEEAPAGRPEPVAPVAETPVRSGVIPAQPVAPVLIEERRADEPAGIDRSVEPPAAEETPETPAPPRVVDPVSAIRAARKVMRAEIVRDERPRVRPEEIAAATPAPTRVDEKAAANEVAPIGAVFEEDQAPVADPVIGPELRAARERAGLSVDELSNRTRIRPHVLEAMEVDDFNPCGGDFYARGHLRTLARYLALDPQELLASYDERYSHAPINARRVFEAELATSGVSGGMRATAGGPRWSLMVGAVLCLLMIWGVARFFTSTPQQLDAATPGASESAGLAANTKPITSPLMRLHTLVVTTGPTGSKVVVRDRTGNVLWSGRLGPNARHKVAGHAPFTVIADNAGAVSLTLDKRAVGTVGNTAQRAHRSIG